MKFFPGLLKALAAGLIAAAVPLAQNLIAFFQGVLPSDVSALLWGAVSFVGSHVLGLAYLLWSLGSGHLQRDLAPSGQSSSISAPPSGIMRG